MKFQIPQISWHSRDPVLSIDFQRSKDNILRLASGGTDSHVLIWYVTYLENKSLEIKFASDLYRHNKSVNVVRFSPNGDLLASGDDEGALFLWQLKEREGQDLPKDEDNVNQEEWYPLKLLRGHLEDIYDISWSADGNFLVSASMDNTAIMWDTNKFQKLHIFPDSKGYVQGVAYDPLNMYIGTIGTDRALRILNINSKKTAYKVQRAPWTITTEKGTFRARLFHDDTLKSYFRRLCFTPDGELLIVPSGILEKDEKLVNTAYIFSRHAPNKPVAYLPTGDKYTIAVRCSPVLYKLRGSENKENRDSKSLINLPYRMMFAVAASDSIIIYDTEQLVPIAYVSNIHYTHLTDLTWSADGKILVAASTDGYCSFIIFNDEELGEVYVPPTPPPSPKKEEPIKQPQLNIISQNVKKDVITPKPLVKVAITPKPLVKVAITPKPLVKVAITLKPLVKVSEKENKPDSSTSENVAAPEKKTVPVSPKDITKSPGVPEAKKPKLTIKSFFTSPKVKPVVSVAKSEPSSETDVVMESKCEDLKIKKEPIRKMPSSSVTTIKKEAVNKKRVTPISQSIVSEDTIEEVIRKSVALVEEVPMDAGADDTIDEVIKKSVALMEKENAPMDIDTRVGNDSCSIEIVCEIKQTEISVPTKDPKCKIQLDFTNQLKDDVSKKVPLPDLVDTDAVASFSESNQSISGNVEKENDWRLELSQDEEIVPMDTSESVAKVEKEINTPETTPKPKRRINLITLSKTVTNTPPKE